ncbi:MAG: hypothetical protein ABIS29_02905, partial [Vicinamibacterales bacterium]
FLLRDLRLAGGAFGASMGASSTGPRRDDRVLADANALAISALVRAAAVLNEPRYLEAAASAARFIDENLRNGARVVHCVHADKRRCSEGFLADHALVALAFLDLDKSASPGESHWLDSARTIGDALLVHFEHAGTGGFFFTADDGATLPLRLKHAQDSAVASGNSAAALLFTRLAARTGDERYAEVAHHTFEAFSEILTLRPLALPSMLSALIEETTRPVNAAPGSSGP